LRSLPGSLGRKATGETTTAMSSTASQPVRRATHVVVGPPPTVPMGPSAKALAQRAKKQAKKARQIAGAQPQTTATSRQQNLSASNELEAMETELSEKPLCLESEGPSTDLVDQGTSEDEEMLLASPHVEEVAEADLTLTDQAEG